MCIQAKGVYWYCTGGGLEVVRGEGGPWRGEIHRLALWEHGGVGSLGLGPVC